MVFCFYCCLDKGELEGESNLMFACGQLHCTAEWLKSGESWGGGVAEVPK